MGWARPEVAWRRGVLGLLLLAMGACNNSPHPAGAEKENTLFTTFDERSPRYLDPTSAYSAPETAYTFHIYEPLYSYHYLKRPYQLAPRAAAAVVKPYYLDAQGRRLAADAAPALIAQSVYEIPLRPGLRYSPHPAFARDTQGRLRYHALTPEQLAGKRSPWDFEALGTRELVAEDFVFALKRHASPRQEAPLFALFSEHVLGLKDYAELLRAENAKLLAGLPAQRPENLPDKPFLDLRRWPLSGAEAVNPHLLRIRIKGKYPQWPYWMAMTFLAPVPWEVEAFYAQTGMSEAGLGWNQWPVGTGPFMMSEYVQDRRHVMRRNPNYREDLYPCDGSAVDRAQGLLADCGKRLPFVDKVVATLVKEGGPRKELFKQGYLDMPEIDRPEWGVEFLVDKSDSADVARQYEDRGYKFPIDVDISSWYLGFNWLDPVVGRGDTPEQQQRNRKLRQALSIAIDWEEGYGQIFRSKGGVAAHGPVPPGVFGSREGQPGAFNPLTHEWVQGRVQRRSIEQARALMVEAGYPDGRDAKTGQPLVLNYDYQRVMRPELKAETDWMVRQFAKLGVQLEVRATDFNQFQEKVLKGTHQVFWWGWFADYPDAENFLFLLYGPNSKSKFEGENAANYENPAFDALYRRLQTLDDGPEKQQVIDDMLAIVREDAPWSWGFWPFVGMAYQPWVYNGKPSIVVRDALRDWNRPIWWPMLLLALGGGWIVWRSRRAFALREQAAAPGYAGEARPR